MHGDPLSNDLFARLIAAATAYPRGFGVSGFECV